MALTGNTVQSTYLDLVQLEKSGAGLPSHAGKEAAVYDGSGAQIIGRTAVRHWLDPHPDAAAFAETFEFSTTGDMTQGQLESAGWTFQANVTGSVSNGVIKLTDATNTSNIGMYRTISFDGDFDISFFPYSSTDTSSAAPSYGVFGVGDSSGDVGYKGWVSGSNQIYTCSSLMGATYSTWAGGTAANASIYHSMLCIRICRLSGTIYVAHGHPSANLIIENSQRKPGGSNGWNKIASASDSRTFDRLWVGFRAPGYNGLSVWGHWIRRFA